MKDWYNRLHLGDCIKRLNSLKTGSVQVDLVFADPPYNIGYAYDVYHDRLHDDAYLAWTEKWLRAVTRVLKPSGTIWVAIGDEYAAETKAIAQQAGLVLRNWVIWYYTFGVHCTRKFSRSHTHLFYFVKDPKRFTFNDDEIRVKSARQLVYNDARAHHRGRVPDNTWILRPQDAQGAFRADHDTWYFARIAGTFKERAGFHGCQMPEQLLGRIIRCCSNPGEVVLDPFAGSGSTLIVAKKLGRQWVGYEVSAEYVRHAKARVASVRPGDPLEGPEDPLSSAPATPLGRGQRRERIDERGILEAFKRASDGYSSDRVIADPVLNAAFVDQCGASGLPGRPRDWNFTLLAMRKAGKLTAIPAKKKTKLSWQNMEPFLFASEMALRRMLDMGHPSLDHVLCDPFTAARFDELARSLAPGFTAFEYRWAALRLRKDARLWRRSSQRFLEGVTKLAPLAPLAGRGVGGEGFCDSLLAKTVPRRPRRIALEETPVARLDDVPAVYLLSMAIEEPRKARPVYVGETSNLLKRAQRTVLAKSALDQFLPNTGHWQLDLFELKDFDQDARRGFQSLLIGRNQPAMNYLELGSRAT